MQGGTGLIWVDPRFRGHESRCWPIQSAELFQTFTAGLFDVKRDPPRNRAKKRSTQGLIM